MGNQTVDFYLPDKKIIIECQGEQHFTGVKFSNSQTQNEIEYMYKQQQIKDENKYYTAKKLGLEIIYFTIPKYFIQKDINIHQDFYKNKILLTDKIKLENLLKNDTNVYSITNNIYLNLNQKLNNIGVVHDDGLCIKNFVIKYVDYNENCEQSAIDYYHNYKKNNYTPIIIFPDEFHYKHNIVINKYSFAILILLTLYLLTFYIILKNVINFLLTIQTIMAHTIQMIRFLSYLRLGIGLYKEDEHYD